MKNLKHPHQLFDLNIERDFLLTKSRSKSCQKYGIRNTVDYLDVKIENDSRV